MITDEKHRYTIESQIGEGSHGTVWLGHYTDDSNKVEKVSIKIAKPGFEDQLRQEYDFLCTIHHPCIIHPIGLFEDQGRVCMSMPYYSQSSYAIKGECDTLTVWRFCESISSALEFIHGEGISHNDVKLSNILIGPNDCFILSDFSCMKIKSQCEVDDWNFGHCIIEMLTGKSYVFFEYHSQDSIDTYLRRAGIKDTSLKCLIKRCFRSPIQAPSQDNRIYYSNDNHTEEPDYIVWTMINDFSIVQKNNKFGLRNRFGSIVIPIENDSISQVGYQHVPGPGPISPLKMRCLFTKGNRCGSYLIDKDFAILELDITVEEWEERETWT